MPTIYEIIFWSVGGFAAIAGMLISLREYNINERRRIFGHD